MGKIIIIHFVDFFIIRFLNPIILINKMTKTIKELENISNNCEADNETEKLIQSVPGFATNLSAIVACEIGDFNRFPSATQLKAYVGIDLRVTQSGDSLKNGKITKRGNAHLRSAFYLAAQVARNHDPELKQFYRKRLMKAGLPEWQFVL